MRKLEFTVEIDAPPERVWDVMLADATYRDWTSAFAEGSQFRGRWEEGEKLVFTDASGTAGMVSMVREARRPETVVLEHVALLKDGLEDTESDEARQWLPAFESYQLTPIDTGTRLQVEMDASGEMVAYFEETWPKALERLQALCEAD